MRFLSRIDLVRPGLLACALHAAGAAAIVAQDPLDPAAGRSVTIAVVSEGPSPGDTLDAAIEAELQALLGPSGANVRFKAVAEFDAGWQAGRMQAALQAALDDPETDYVLTRGLLITQAATQMELTKPVVSAFVQRLDLFKVADIQGDRSLKENLSFILIPNRADTDLRAAAELEDERTFHVVIAEEYLEQLTDLDAEIRGIEAAADITIAAIPITGDVSESLARVPENTRGVTLVSTPRFTLADRIRFITELAARDIRVFSLQGHEDVEVGALASRTPPLSVLTARRAALNLSELIRGVATSELPVLVAADPQLLINGATAADIGFRPSLLTLSFASFINEEALELEEQTLSLADAFRLAQAGNWQLQIANRDLEITRQEKQLALSPILPQISFDPFVNFTDPAGLDGLIPERLVSLRLSGSQMIYNDATISDYRSSSRLLDSEERNYEADRLDIIEQAGATYMRWALARVLYRIEIQNLRLTEQNLELAKFRTDVGYSGRDEVFRWEAEVARRRSQLFDRLSDVEIERIAFNRLLGVDQNRRWQPMTFDVDGQELPFLDGRTPNLISDSRALEAFRAFAVGYSFESSPELQSLLLEVEGQEIQLGQRKRTWWLPEFRLGGRVDFQVDREPALEGVDTTIPSLQLSATYPIFAGGSRSFEVSRVSAELQRLQFEERQTRDQVEERTRASLRRMEASFPSIRFNRVAADNARRNFELVQDKYQQGLVNVTDLLEAQTNSFVADQAAAAAVYVFLNDLIAFQRAISWFEAEESPAERDALARRIQDAIQR